MTTKSCQKQNQVFEVFVTANELQTTEKNVKCPQKGCTKTFVHNGALSMHLVKSHGLVKTDQDRCLYSSIRGKKVNVSCSFQYYCPAERCIYKKHQNDPEASRYFSTFKLLKQHYQKVHAEKVFKCDKCPAAYGLERELRRHLEHCGVLFKCGSCPVSYTTKETLQSHCNRKEHNFPEDYSVKKGSKQKQRANKTAPSSSTPVPEPRPMPVAVLILGLPSPPKDKPKLPRAILPVDVQKPMEAVNTEQLEEAESASRETETPVRQNAVIQTEIYGVENLAVEGRENQPNAKVVGTKQDKNVIKPVQRTAKSRLKPDKENLQMSTNKKSTTGMQTSVSLFPRKRLKTVTGTQTSGDYILKKAMASADIPIQRKTVGSQVTPQKPGAKLARKRATCSSETQTGISPEKKSKDDAETGLTDGSVESGVQFEKEIEVAEILSDSFPASAQSFKSNIERNKQMGVNTISGNILSITPNGNLLISPSSSGRAAQKADNVVNPLADTAPTFIESLGLKATKTQSMVSKQISTSSSEPTNAATSRFENTGGTIASTKDKTMKPKRNTIRNLLTESEKNYVPISESTRIYRPFISTTSGITFNTSLATYSNSHTAQTVTSSNKTATSSSVSLNEHYAQPDYDSHKLFNPMDQMLGGRQNENSNTNTIDMEAQAMSASEFEQLLLSSGLLLEVGAQTEPISEYGIQNGTPNLNNTASLCGHNKVTGFDHKEMATETLTEFDFLNESSSTIDMNTQTITDFGSLLGPMDSDTQTVSGIDFLDLVMTNMETQTLSDQDLIDLGLMDTAQTPIEPFCMEMDYLKSSETQTSLVSLVESGTNSGMDRNSRNIDHNTTMVDKNKTSKTSETMTEKVISAATALTILGNNRNTEAKCVKDNNNANKDAAAEPQNATNSEQKDQSEGFQTNMETQTAFDELEKLAS